MAYGVLSSGAVNSPRAPDSRSTRTSGPAVSVGRGVVRGIKPLIGSCHELPQSGAALQRMVDLAVQQALSWLVQATGATQEPPIEAQLSCLLALDASDIERGWEEAAARDGVLGWVSDGILASLLVESTEARVFWKIRTGAH